MAGAAPAYRTSVAPQRPARTTRVTVVPGGKAQPVSPVSVAVLRLVAMAIAIVAIVALSSVSIAVATVRAQIATEDLSTQITEMKSETASLELRVSTLSTPNYIKGRATTELGMVPEGDATVITLEPDVVALDDNGNLSIALTLAQATRR